MQAVLILILILFILELSNGNENVEAISTQQLTTSTGRITVSINSASDQYQWLISPSVPTSQIQLIFESINNRQAELRIYDSSSSSYIWNCVSCGSLVPPPFTSSTGSVIIYIKGVSGVSFTSSSFTLFYVGIPSTLTSPLSNLTINLNMGYASISPYQSMAGMNPANAVQRWVISQSNTITFAFSWVNITSSEQLLIYDTANIARPLYNSSRADAESLLTKWLYATSGNALIIFSTASSSMSTFLLTYYVDTGLFNCGSFTNPNNLLGDSLFISDGSASSDLMRRSASCSWLINPVSSSTVSLVMGWVSLKYGSSVLVYDGASSSSTLLWNGQGGTTTVPPVITSSGSYLYIVYVSDATAPVIYKGFYGSYYSNYMGSVGIGSGYSSMAMSSSLDISPPGNTTVYSPGLNYTWYVTPTLVTGTIMFAFSQLNLAHKDDVIYLYDGNLQNNTATLLTTFRGTTKTPKKWFITQQKIAAIVFQASDSSPRGNLQLAYYTDGSNYHCGFIRNPAAIKMTSWVLTDGSSSSEAIYSSQNCLWDVLPGGEESNMNVSAIFISFNRFSLTSGAMLIIYIGSPTKGKVFTVINATSAIPPPILLPTNRVGLSYITGSSPAGYGFSLTYYAVQDAYSFPGDGVVRLYSSSVFSLTSARHSEGIVGVGCNLTWMVMPASAKGKIYFMVNNISLPDCSAQLTIYDGSSLESAVLATLCGRSLPDPYQWIETSAANAVLSLTSTANVKGDFEVSYFSDGSNYRCGMLTSPVTLTAPSMIFSDGSSSTEAIYSAQRCSWLIQPYIVATMVNPVIVIDFINLDLAGATLVVYSGSSANAGAIVWSCSSCSNLPDLLIIRGEQVLITFASASAAYSYGTGFSATYWTTEGSPLEQLQSQSQQQSVLLELPSSLKMTKSLDGSSAAYVLTVPTTLSSLSVFPSYESSLSDVSLELYDGRPPGTFQSTSYTSSLCGLLTSSTSNNNAILQSSTVYFQPTQLASAFIKKSAISDNQRVYTIAGDNGSNNDDVVQSADVCNYRFYSPSTQPLTAFYLILSFSGSEQSNSFTTNTLMAATPRVRVYGGLTANYSLLFDSYQSVIQNNAMVSMTGGTVNVTIPCGQSIVLIERNTSSAITSNASVNVEYVLVPNDSGQACALYVKSLQPDPSKSDPLLPVYISLGGAGGLIMIIAAMVYISKLKARRGYVFYPQGQSSPPRRAYLQVTPSQPKYKSYLESALGDIGMFPVKCPMHYEQCTGILDANIARRILTEPQFRRFLDFSDRALYGDGMRCIFCQNYVTFPPDMTHMARVECPYCIQCFCIRCKKPWHYGSRCPMEVLDESLEDWKTRSGAQKCPACKKLIEKEDPETCNHMVHKITDSIPCVHLCGEEVTSNYPHEEVANLGVNHFPEGVFNKCRTIIIQEKQAEIDRLKRRKRLKNQYAVQNSRKVAPNNGNTTPNEWDEVMSTDPGTPATAASASPLTRSVRSDAPRPRLIQAVTATTASNTAGGGGSYDQFDQEWDLALALAQANASPSRSTVTSPPVSARTTILQGARGSAIAFSPPTSRRVSSTATGGVGGNSTLPTDRGSLAVGSGRGSPEVGRNQQQQGSPPRGRTSTRFDSTTR
eukprot:scaffold5903_cov165-Ochromonas_danica.AAC.3